MRKYHQQAEVDELVLRLDRAEVERLLNEELHRSALSVGVAVISEMLEEDVRRMCGQSGKRTPKRQGYRHGSQGGYVVMGGQKVRLEKPRVRSIDGKRELSLLTYRHLQRVDVISQRVLERLVRGVSCRSYRSVIDTIGQAVGNSRSSVSRQFIKASEERVRQFMMRRFEGVRFAAIFIDGARFKGQTMVVAIGIDSIGTKRVLSVRQGATENARVCADLLEELRQRGVDTEQTTLFVLDGSKALHGAVERVWGTAALIQRCRLHKIRNVQAYVPERLWPEVLTQLRRAYAEIDYRKARRSLETTARWLDRVAPAAARSLREGLDQTLTVCRMKLPHPLRRSLTSTNLVESPFARIRSISRRVTRWQGDMRLRWCVAGLLEAEQRFIRIPGAHLMDKLLAALDQNTAEVAA
jgi:putative transposase